jgi:hypothetical protein
MLLLPAVAYGSVMPRNWAGLPYMEPTGINCVHIFVKVLLTFYMQMSLSEIPPVQSKQRLEYNFLHQGEMLKEQRVLEHQDKYKLAQLANCNEHAICGTNNEKSVLRFLSCFTKNGRVDSCINTTDAGL